MMACTVEMDRSETGIRVSWQSGMQPVKEKIFADRREAEAFADKKMGARGMCISTLDMSPEKLAAHLERKARQLARMDEILAGMGR